VTYFPGVFDVATPDEAVCIILTAEGLTTQHRWATETPYFADLITNNINPRDRSPVLDYGCGIGRMAEALIDRHRCHVIRRGHESSMRSLAMGYVASDNFAARRPHARSHAAARCSW